MQGYVLAPLLIDESLKGSAQSAIRAIQEVGEGLTETGGGGQRKQRKAIAGQARRSQQDRKEAYHRKGMKATAGQAGRLKKDMKEGYNRTGRKARSEQAGRLQQDRKEGYSKTGRKATAG